MVLADSMEFTGERVIPGEVDADLLNEHLARYAFAARLARGKRVLDAGCGAGYGSAELVKSALSVVGVDSAADATAYAREHYRLPNLHFEQASCTVLPHPDATFDLVVAFEVIEHLADWREFLLETRRVLAAGGQFIVSTPNKLYYAESRGPTGPNPFHAHEFEFGEFRDELSSVFPHISLFLENHVEGVVFRPVGEGEGAEVRMDGADAVPAESHFFVAVCGYRPLAGNSSFVYVPSSANVLRERETHIALLEGELRQKDNWLEHAKQELLTLDQEHRKLMEELEERNRWAESLNRELHTRGARILELQKEQESVHIIVQTYEDQIGELAEENRKKTKWAGQLDTELAGKVSELAQCVEYLHQAEATIDERTHWARALEADVERLKILEASIWVRLGRSVGLTRQTNQK